MATSFTLSVETQRLCELMQSAPEGMIIPYEELSAAAGLDVQRTKAGRDRVASARSILLRQHRRVFLTIRGVGLQVAKDGDKAHIALREGVPQIKSAARRAVKKTIAVDDYASLSTEEKHAHNTGLAIVTMVATSVDARNIKRIAAGVSVNGVPPLAEVMQRTLEAFKAAK